jgi:DNA polymerase (family 10)
MKTPLARSRALEIAQRVGEILTPAAVRCEIAGSLRRCKPTVGDVDLLVISQPPRPVFGQAAALPIDTALRAAGLLVTKQGRLARHFWCDNVYVDLWLADPATWGCRLAIRTGSADFSHWLVTHRSQGGACPNDMMFKDGRLWRAGYLLDTPEEADVFDELDLAWIEPTARERGSWWLPFGGAHALEV